MASHEHDGPDPKRHPASGTLEQRLDTYTGVSSSGYLLMMRGPSPGRLSRLTAQTTTLGRGDEADICVEDSSVSTMHAKILLNGSESWVADLGSTNGTFVNEELVVGTAQLRVGDALRLGNSIFAYLTEDGAAGSNETVSLRGEHSGTLTRRAHLQLPAGSHAAEVARAANASVTSAPADEGLSLLDYVEYVRVALSYLRRYAWLLVTFVCLGLTAGVVHFRLNPPPVTAWFEMTLLTRATSNPLIASKGDGHQVIFMAAESAFTSLPNIKKTLRALGHENPSDGAASGIQNRLSFAKADRWGDVWRGEYEAATPETAETFLKTHLQLYLDEEIEKTLKVITAENELLAKQVGEAQQELQRIEGELTAFREKHPEVVLDLAEAVLTPAEKLGNLKAGVTSGLRGTQLEIARLTRQLNSGDSLLVDKVKDASKYENEIATVRAEVAQAKSEGLTDHHPKVRRLNARIAELERLVAETVAAKSTEVQKRTNKEYRQLRERIEELKRAEKDKSKKLGSIENDIAANKEEALTLPQLQTRYREMELEQEGARKLYQTLRDKRKSAELQLEMERAAGHRRYDIITPPTVSPADMTGTMMKRLLVGGVAGLFLAALIAAGLELRRLIKTAGRTVRQS